TAPAKNSENTKEKSASAPCVFVNPVNLCSDGFSVCMGDLRFGQLSRIKARSQKIMELRRSFFIGIFSFFRKKFPFLEGMDLAKRDFQVSEMFPFGGGGQGRPKLFRRNRMFREKERGTSNVLV
ncbi:hypothetical protein, partial [Leptospira ilyithenensis]|uniref:hypothetical protein n=1 Tax=Leptospira ilyithenensis TaxID=2484901 RepID=UPI001AEFF879